jgi:hypothetical protein
VSFACQFVAKKAGNPAAQPRIVESFKRVSLTWVAERVDITSISSLHVGATIVDLTVDSTVQSW